MADVATTAAATKAKAPKAAAKPKVVKRKFVVTVTPVDPAAKVSQMRAALAAVISFHAAGIADVKVAILAEPKAAK